MRTPCHSSRDNSQYQAQMTLLRHAIKQQQCLTFNYKNKARQAEPYQLINHSGLWYLAAVHDGQLKAFELGLMQLLSCLADTFIPNPATLGLLKLRSGISFGATTSVTLKVSAAAAPYIQRRPLFYKQKIHKQHADGSLTITTEITEQEHLYRWLRYWLPEIDIIEPVALATKFRSKLKFLC
ncbi:MAG: WYL domain-containing protein [Aeromonas sp.]